jgi:hypothetical protein
LERHPHEPRGTGALAATLLRKLHDGDDTYFWELHHQVCHQFAVGAVAYVAVPHLVTIAKASPIDRLPRLLGLVGTVEAARHAYGRSAALLRDEWRAEYLAANEEALRMAGEALQRPEWELPDSWQLLATSAALHGHIDLALHLFNQPGEPKPSCPNCGEYIEFGEPGTDKPAPQASIPAD